MVVEEEIESIKEGSVVEEEREEEVTQPADTKHLTPESVDAEQQHQENRTKTAFNLPTDNSSQSSSLGQLRFKED